MAKPAGESNAEVLRLDFDRRLMLQFRGSVVTSDAGLLAYWELDAALGLTTMAGDILADARIGNNGRHAQKPAANPARPAPKNAVWPPSISDRRGARHIRAPRSCCGDGIFDWFSEQEVGAQCARCKSSG